MIEVSLSSCVCVNHGGALCPRRGKREKEIAASSNGQKLMRER